jgi:two-component system phosphate regulon sensor histidine kinase PhoR
VPPELVAAGAVLALAVLLGWAGFSLGRRSSRREPAHRPAPLTATPAPEPTLPAWSADATAIIEALDVGVLRLDADLRVVQANGAAGRLLGFDGRSLAHRSLMEAFVDHRVEELAREGPAHGTSSIEIGGRDGEERRIAVRLRRAADGGLWLLLEDVTELRRLQRIRSEFIDNLSHELRTPLTTVRLLAETLQQDLEGADVPPRMRERIGKIDVETGHLVQTVNELLDLSRIEGGAAQLHFDSVDMVELISSTLDRLRTFAERQGVSLGADFAGAEALPRVRGDAERLGQVLVNLLHNAIKFSPPDSRVTVSARVEGDALAVAVRDEGIGIPSADIERVFERFYKVDKARRHGLGGTGLGLSIARHIIAGHGGRLWVDSEEGRGSTFTFSVPLIEPPEPASAA